MSIGVERSAEGHWRDLHTVAPKHEQVRTYLDADKIGWQMKEEAKLRQVYHAMKTLFLTQERQLQSEEGSAPSG